MSPNTEPAPNRFATTVAPTDPLARVDSFWLHGAGLAGDTWHPITKGYTKALKPDLPGHGANPLSQPYRVEAYAERLSDCVPPGSVLIGHSLGGMVALELAARLKDRIEALILIEAVPTVRDRLVGRLSATVAASLYCSIPTSWLANLSGLGESPDTKAELRRQLARMDRRRISAALEAASLYDGRPRLAEIAVPTLIIVGKRNSATHHVADLMAQRIRGAEYFKLPGGHMLHTDNPVQLRRSISGFLRRTGTAES
ncbi:MAG: alpha/beta fold hydrolase [Pseudomonadota bacterium]